jgi:GMP synthase PP-ATPase subunit
LNIKRLSKSTTPWQATGLLIFYKNHSKDFKDFLNSRENLEKKFIDVCIYTKSNENKINSINKDRDNLKLNIIKSIEQFCKGLNKTKSFQNNKKHLQDIIELYRKKVKEKFLKIIEQDTKSTRTEFLNFYIVAKNDKLFKEIDNNINTIEQAKNNNIKSYTEYSTLFYKKQSFIP